MVFSSVSIIISLIAFPKMITSEKKLAGTVSPFSDSRFNIEDFKSRWTSARVAALKSVLGCQHPCSNENLDFDLDEEHLLLMGVKADQRDLVLRAVFDFSRKLGVGFSRYFGISLEIQDLAEILPFFCGAGVLRPPTHEAK